MPDLTFRRYDALSIRQIRPTVEAIYNDSYVEAISGGDPFDSVETFMARFDSYTTGARLDVVVAWMDAEPVGQAWGWPLPADTRVWRGVIPSPSKEFTTETGHRTFILSEIMVRQGWKGQGIAHALHDELLAGRHEERARLLVRPDNIIAYRAYLKWGWSKVGQRRPEWPNAPLFDVLLLPLPIYTE
jgi:GNAT superfamily N-acetyltransferase